MFIVYREIVFVQTLHSIYTLSPRPLDDRVKHLVLRNQFDVAIQLQVFLIYSQIS